MLDINVSLFIQIANFLILLFLLNRFLYRPIRQILIEREGEMDSLQETIDDYEGQSGEQERSIEESKVLARKEGYQEKENYKAEGLEEEQSIIQGAVASAENKLGQAKVDMENVVTETRRALEEQITVFSRELAEKILGRTVQ
jgi:F-type H+-transporting ATPase subunit b